MRSTGTGDSLAPKQSRQRETWEFAGTAAFTAAMTVGEVAGTGLIALASALPSPSLSPQGERRSVGGLLRAATRQTMHPLLAAPQPPSAAPSGMFPASPSG